MQISAAIIEIDYQMYAWYSLNNCVYDYVFKVSD